MAAEAGSGMGVMHDDVKRVNSMLKFVVVFCHGHCEQFLAGDGGGEELPETIANDRQYL
jgi:hypothetical protein